MSKSIKDTLDAIDEMIIDESITNIVGDKFGSYSKYIIQDRALPDLRDGLKPVQRRILFAMYKLGMFADKPYKKSARIAGDVMGKYHPHGDSSIYEAMVRMSQYWKMNLKLIDMHGNNGSIDGDPAAAMRYTEARLSKEAEYLLQDIEKKTVEFVPNFDDEELEPTVLPSKYPNILVNGATGISAGYATNIPPHNVSEVIQATIYRINNPKSKLSDLTKFIKGPDFPTGGIVQGVDGIKTAYKDGSGRIIIRSKTEFEETKKDNFSIIITEVPFEVNKANLVKKIDDIRIDKKLDGIKEVRDESDRDGLRIAIELKKDADKDFILQYLFKHTNLQVSYNFNMVAIDKKKPVKVGLETILDSYIRHQKDVIRNRSNFDKNRAEKRLHVVEGLVKMVDVVDEIVKIIRSSKGKAESKQGIIDKFGFTDIQAEAIITLQLYRLSNTDISALVKENDQLTKEIAKLTKILDDEKQLQKVIISELEAIEKQIGKPRQTIIEKEIEKIEISQKDLVSEEEVVISLSNGGDIKRTSIRSFIASSGVAGHKENDSILYQAHANTVNTILVFTSKGNYLYIPVYKIPDKRWKENGEFIGSIIPIEPDDYIVSAIVVDDFERNIDVMIATERGLLKQTELSEFQVSRYSRPIRAMKISKDDKVVAVSYNENNYHDKITMITDNGLGLTFGTDEVSKVGTSAGGVKGANVKDNEKLVACLYTKDGYEVTSITADGFVKNSILKDIISLKRTKRPKKFIELIASDLITDSNIIKSDKAIIGFDQGTIVISKDFGNTDVFNHNGNHIEVGPEFGRTRTVSNLTVDYKE